MGGQVLGEVVKGVVGLGGVAASTYAASSQVDTLNQLMAQGQDQRNRVAGIDEYFLGGGRASKLNIPGMQEQFAAVDYGVEQQMRELDSQSRKASQAIVDNIPPGGARLRALADVAMQTQEQKGQAIRAAQDRKRELDVQLTNSYMQQAMNRNVGPSYDAQMWAAAQDYQNRQRDIEAIGSALGHMTDAWVAGQEPGQRDIEYTAGKEVPGALTGAQDIRKDFLEPYQVPFRYPDSWYKKKKSTDITGLG